MKKYLVLTTMLFASACAQGPIVGDEDCTYDTKPAKNYRVEEPAPAPVAPAPVVVQQPAPIVVQRPAPIVVAQPTIPCYTTTPVVTQPEPCNGCQPTVRATREPVEVVYKKVTYTTTYEPKTTSDVSYEREAVTGVAAPVAVQRPVEVVVQRPATQEVVVQRPAAQEIVVQQPAVSRVIETQVNQDPVRISVE